MPATPLNIFFPGKLVFGNGTLAGLADDIVQLDPKKIFIVTIEPLRSALDGLLKSFEQNGIEVVTDTSIVAEPGFSDFERLLRSAVPLNPDIIIGVGGGSVLDIAKLVAAQLENEQ
jgi:alcohol dehydrogenase class IV